MRAVGGLPAVSRMDALRIGIGALGIALIGIGAMKLLDLGWDNTVATVTWLVAGVILHDFVLTPVVLLGGLVVARFLPVWSRLPVAVGAIVLGTVTIMAIPVLGRFGARDDNATLLDRNYTAGWFGFAAIIAVLVAYAAYRSRATALAAALPDEREELHELDELNDDPLEPDDPRRGGR